MLIECPHCGGKIMVNGLGRKALNIPLINVYDALRLYRSVGDAAVKLGCSRAYVYKVLNAKRLIPADVINGRVTEREFVSLPG